MVLFWFPFVMVCKKGIFANNSKTTVKEIVSFWEVLRKLKIRQKQKPTNADALMGFCLKKVFLKNELVDLFFA
ncbi:hypothetical protein SAMN04487935_0534 [Flavobacterium noncentrifugens]|uniref:Uncharacterized protein n=1 Tax=Flavobacterium noncentrifugens TaxID=1128970 RepID=A0A1G8SFH3_9FLAO|nr:hypothetical protein SAMN04487935_0534 [Flavobacterium noncentrifugens]